ncbi:MAG TPA: class I SAM-dependent methyltransferase [Nanoarchaeota archaeon]|nr:class I SAM-dependent methyltransferase [Nanoarchaeota archaeon]
MAQSKIIRARIVATKKANAAELNYRNVLESQDLRTNTIEKWFAKQSDGRLEYLPWLKKNGWVPYGRVLELGAGSCWFSSQISREKGVKNVFSLEFSEYLLTQIAPRIMGHYGADTKKITRVLGDFNHLEFPGHYFDYVVFDAAMHHATDLPNVLKEAVRVLKKGGRIIAIREPVIPPLMPWKRFTFGREDKQYGITENIYSLSQWGKFFADAGLRLKAVPFIPPTSLLKHILNLPLFTLFNRIFLGHYVFICD